VIPENRFPLRKIAVSPLRGGGLLRKPLGLLNLFKATCTSVKIVRQEKAATVLGMGGYVSGPVCLAAKVTGCRLVVHEQNAVPGFTNRILRHLANRVLEALPDTFVAQKKVVCTGNPVRQDLLNVAAPDVRYSDRDGALRVLVIGGSQGARALNQKVPEALSLVKESLDVIHQCGPTWYKETVANYSDVEHSCDVREFIDDMAEVYRWADVIICRSGAMTVAEIAAVGVASILIPYPAAVDDHQTANGNFLVKAKAAVMIQEQDITSIGLADQFQNFSREKLKSMAVNARQVSKRDATERVVAELVGVAA